MCGIVICCEQTSNINPETWFMLFLQGCATMYDQNGKVHTWSMATNPIAGKIV